MFLFLFGNSFLQNLPTGRYFELDCTNENHMPGKTIAWKKIMRFTLPTNDTEKNRGFHILPRWQKLNITDFLNIRRTQNHNIVSLYEKQKWTKQINTNTFRLYRFEKIIKTKKAYSSKITLLNFVNRHSSESRLSPQKSKEKQRNFSFYSIWQNIEQVSLWENGSEK